MIIRLFAIGLVGLVLMGYAPRWLSTGSEAWVIWVVAAAVVFGGPRLLRHVAARAIGELRAIGGRVTGRPVR